MFRVLVLECMQEVSSFNPVQSAYENFRIDRGNSMLSQRGLNTAIGGALAVLEADPEITVVPGYGARSDSAGPLSAAGWQRLSSELLEVVDRHADVDAVLVSLHGAMAAIGELDPEGALLSEIRLRVGPQTPIVMSLDLHGIVTARMIEAVNGLAIYYTYPHRDFADTGARAARVLLKLLRERPATTIVRVTIPALVRGNELVTDTGIYGEYLRECLALEQSGAAIAAGVMIGNPFTDVPELCSQVLVMTDRDPAEAVKTAERIAAAFWAERNRMQAHLTPLSEAIAGAKAITDGTVLFSDAADAPSSGSSGDSNLLIKGLSDAGYSRKVLAQIVDAGAAAAAHRAGVGATIEVNLGGALDTKRFSPMRVVARVKLLSDGESRLETMGIPLSAGPTAVLTFDNFTVVVFSRSLSLFDRAMYYSNGIDPVDYDLVVVKSPHTEHHMYEAWVRRNFIVDVAGSTSANLPTLGHTICARPMFPLDPEVPFTPRATLFHSRLSTAAARAAAQ